MIWAEVAPWIESVVAIVLVLAALVAMFKTRYLLPYFNRQQTKLFPSNETCRQVGFGEIQGGIDGGDAGGDCGGDAGC